MSRYRPGTYIALFIGAHFAHHLLTALVVPILPYIRDGFGLTYAQSGLVVSAFTLSYGIGQLPAGWFADRLGRGYLITVGIAGVALAGAIAGLTTTYTGLIVALIAMGIAGGGYHPSAAPLITASVPPERRGRALGLHLVGGSASHFVTPLLGAAIASQFGWRGSFLGIAGPVFFFGLAFFLILRNRGEQRYSAEPAVAAATTGASADASIEPGSGMADTGFDSGTAASLAGGAKGDDRSGARPQDGSGEHPGRETESSGARPQDGSGQHTGRETEPSGARPAAAPNRRRTIIRISIFLVMTSAVGAAIASMTAFVPLYMVDGFGLSEELGAATLSLFFVTGVVAAPIGGALSDRFGPVPILILLSVAAGPLMMLGAALPSAILFAGILLALGIATFFRMPVSEAYLSEDVPERMRSTVLGVYFFAGMEANGVITPILGHLIDTQGFEAAFGLFGLVLTVVAVTSAAALYVMHLRAGLPARG